MSMSSASAAALAALAALAAAAVASALVAAAESHRNLRGKSESAESGEGRRAHLVKAWLAWLPDALPWQQRSFAWSSPPSSTAWASTPETPTLVQAHRARGGAWRLQTHTALSNAEIARAVLHNIAGPPQT